MFIIFSFPATVIPNSTGPSSVNVTVVPAPGAGMAQGPPPVGFTAQPGGNQGTGYPVQPNYAPQPGYPVQPNYHQQPGYPPQPGYPAQPGYPPYPQNAGPANQTQSGYPQPGYYSGYNKLEILISNRMCLLQWLLFF